MTHEPLYHAASHRRRLKERDPLDDWPMIRIALIVAAVYFLFCMGVGYWVEHPGPRIQADEFSQTVSQGVDRLDHGDAGDGTKGDLKPYWPS